MEFYVETPRAMHLVIETTENGRVVRVLPAPVESLPAVPKPTHEITEIQL